MKLLIRLLKRITAIITLYTLQTKLRVALVATCCVSLAVQHARTPHIRLFPIPKCMGSWRYATGGIWTLLCFINFVLLLLLLLLSLLLLMTWQGRQRHVHGTGGGPLCAHVSNVRRWFGSVLQLVSPGSLSSVAARSAAWRARHRTEQSGKCQTPSKRQTDKETRPFVW